MNALPGLFRDPAAFRDAFVRTLVERALVPTDLGSFILVLANASLEPGLGGLLVNRLRTDYARWAERLATEGRDGLQAADYDVAVLERLVDSDLAIPEASSRRTVGPWELLFNPVRALRPPRMSGAAVNHLCEPFNPQGFHFNKACLQSEILWEGELMGDPVRLLHNKFPFTDLHCLLVRRPERESPQWLTEEDHRAVWGYCEVLGAGLPGWGLGYNAYGAYASVNHQHFQSYLKDGGVFPIEHEHWRHNGGDVDYPLSCETFTDPRHAWQRIEELHSGNNTYNLLYRPGRLYLVPRAFQGSYVHAAWTSGFAWSELAGSLTISRPGDFKSLDSAAVEAEFAKLRLPAQRG